MIWLGIEDCLLRKWTMLGIRRKWHLSNCQAKLSGL